ncbi:MAG: DUF896 domain-containing protein [Clostridia bacterium]|nr:DUF896 domain-containing protein [Clostridia bacterium]
MDQKMIDRINALARKSREEGLSEEEKAEQQKLREAYIQAFRGNLKQQLDNIEVVRPDGTRENLKGKQL